MPLHGSELFEKEIRRTMEKKQIEIEKEKKKICKQ